MDHIRMWHQDASNSSDGLPVILGSQSTHWNNEQFLAEPKKETKKTKKREGREKAFFLGKSPGVEWKRKTFIGLSPETGRLKKIIYAKNLAKIQVHYAIFLFDV